MRRAVVLISLRHSMIEKVIENDHTCVGTHRSTIVKKNNGKICSVGRASVPLQTKKLILKISKYTAMPARALFRRPFYPAPKLPRQGIQKRRVLIARMIMTTRFSAGLCPTHQNKKQQPGRYRKQSQNCGPWPHTPHGQSLGKRERAPATFDRQVSRSTIRYRIRDTRNMRS